MRRRRSPPSFPSIFGARRAWAEGHCHPARVAQRSQLAAWRTGAIDRRLVCAHGIQGDRCPARPSERCGRRKIQVGIGRRQPAGARSRQALLRRRQRHAARDRAEPVCDRRQRADRLGHRRRPRPQQCAAQGRLRPRPADRRGGRRANHDQARPTPRRAVRDRHLQSEPGTFPVLGDVGGQCTGRPAAGGGSRRAGGAERGSHARAGCRVFSYWRSTVPAWQDGQRPDRIAVATVSARHVPTGRRRAARAADDASPGARQFPRAGGGSPAGRAGVPASARKRRVRRTGSPSPVGLPTAGRRRRPARWSTAFGRRTSALAW